MLHLAYASLLLSLPLQRQRPKLQDILKKVIADAQASGALLWSGGCWLGGTGSRSNMEQHPALDGSHLACRLSNWCATGWSSALVKTSCNDMDSGCRPICFAGELWTRDWEAMPLPDLTQSAADAAAVLAEVAAVSGPAGAGQAQRASRWGAQQQQGGQSPYAAAQQYAAAQAQQYQQQQQYGSQQQYAAQQRQMKQQQRQPKKWAQKQRVDLEEDRYGRRWAGRKQGEGKVGREALCVRTGWRTA